MWNDTMRASSPVTSTVMETQTTIKRERKWEFHEYFCARIYGRTLVAVVLLKFKWDPPRANAHAHSWHTRVHTHVNKFDWHLRVPPIPWRMCQWAHLHSGLIWNADRSDFIQTLLDQMSEISFWRTIQTVCLDKLESRGGCNASQDSSRRLELEMCMWHF